MHNRTKSVLLTATSISTALLTGFLVSACASGGAASTTPTPSVGRAPLVAHSLVYKAYVDRMQGTIPEFDSAYKRLLLDCANRDPHGQCAVALTTLGFKIKGTMLVLAIAADPKKAPYIGAVPPELTSLVDRTNEVSSLLLTACDAGRVNDVMSAVEDYRKIMAEWSALES